MSCVNIVNLISHLSLSCYTRHSRFDIYGLDKSAHQDEKGIRAAAAKGESHSFTRLITNVSICNQLLLPFPTHMCDS